MSPPSSSADSTRDLDKKSVQRKINKPLIEKRRRARINDCLTQLKAIVLDAYESKNPRPSKLEKADILEMTVEFVKSKINSDQSIKSQDVSSSNGQAEYLAGYTKCLAEISNYLENTRPNTYVLKRDIVNHVTAHLNNHISLDAPHSVNTCIGPKPGKLPLPPLAHLTMHNGSKSEALDLRMNSTQENEISQHSLDNIPETNKQSSPPNNVSHSNMPLGFLCGGQIMLLVQLPASMATQQINTRCGQCPTPIPTYSAISVQEKQSNNPDILTIPKAEDKLNFNNESVCTPPALYPIRIGSIPNTNEFHTINFETQFNQAHTEPGDHWRPW